MLEVPKGDAGRQPPTIPAPGRGSAGRGFFTGMRCSGWPGSGIRAKSGSRAPGSGAAVHRLPLRDEVIDVLAAQAPGMKSLEPLRSIVPDPRWQGRDADRCRRKATEVFPPTVSWANGTQKDVKADTRT